MSDGLRVWSSSFPSTKAGGNSTTRAVDYLREAGGKDGRWSINAASGWNDIHPYIGDIADVHNYEKKPFGGLEGTFKRWGDIFPTGPRARVLGEMGGLGCAVPDHLWSPNVSWGYNEGKEADVEGFRTEYLALFTRLEKAVCSDRLAGAIYTQWTDVESEVNGLLTYDRIEKLPRELLADASSSVYRAFDRCIVETAR